jgi:hypothetical protein
MNETVHNLVNAIQTGNAAETENTFAAAMADKLTSRLDDLRQTIAQSMFTQPEAVVEEEYELSEEEVAAVSAIDEADLNMLTDEELESIQEAQQWIASAIKHPGAETKAAKRAGMTTHEYAEKHKHDKGTAGKRARLALTLSKISKKK